MSIGDITRRFAMLGAGAAGISGLMAQERAQAVPDRITLVVPFAAGGSADIMARIVAQRVAQLLQVNVIIDNRAGAGGNLAGSYVARSAPNGSTLLWGTISTHALNPLIAGAGLYDPVKDFAPISLLVTLPNVMLINPSVPARNVGEFIALLKAAPHKYAFASSGVGTPLHLSGELFKHLSGTEMSHVPYRGAGPALNDLVAGHIPVMFDTLASAIPHIQSGAARALAITTSERSQAMPNLPTVHEAGLPGYDTYAWHALFGPVGMPSNTVEILADAAKQALQTSEVATRLQELGAVLHGSSPNELGVHVRAELAKWTPIVGAARIKLER